MEKISVKDAIGHLPSLESGESSDILYHYAKKHSHRNTSVLKHTPSGKTALQNAIHYPKKEDGTRIKGFATTYKRIEWEKPAPTITMANGSVSSQNNVHPGRKKEDGTYSDARVLSLKEIFILTGLPNEWHPPKWASENLIRHAIGEGVPPKLIDALLTTLPK
jgi:DNA (cytosine-5)-methyltransferase 1